MALNRFEHRTVLVLIDRLHGLRDLLAYDDVGESHMVVPTMTPRPTCPTILKRPFSPSFLWRKTLM